MVLWGVISFAGMDGVHGFAPVFDPDAVAMSNVNPRWKGPLVEGG